MSSFYLFLVFITLQQVLFCESHLTKSILLKTRQEINEAVAKLQATQDFLDNLINQEDEGAMTKKEVANDEMDHFEDTQNPTEQDKKLSGLIQEIRLEQVNKPSKDKRHMVKDFKEIKSLENLNAKQSHNLRKALIIGGLDHIEPLNEWENVEPIEKYLESVIPKLSLAVGLGEKEIFNFLLSTMDILTKHYKWTSEIKHRVLLKVSSNCLATLRSYYKAMHGVNNKMQLKEEQVAKVLAQYLEIHHLEINTVKIVSKSMVMALVKLTKDNDSKKKLDTSAKVWTRVLSELALSGKLKSYL